MDVEEPKRMAMKMHVAAPTDRFPGYHGWIKFIYIYLESNLIRKDSYLFLPFPTVNKPFKPSCDG